MINWFYSLAFIITAIFFISFVIIFFCALKIYGNVEEALIKIKRKKKNE